MRNLNELNGFRVKERFVLEQFGSYGDKDNGMFMIPYLLVDEKLKCIASNGAGWDHVSISIEGNNRTPSWAEMEFVKRAFFNPTEVVVQLHVAEEDHLSIHPHVLHLWRKHDFIQPLPPKMFV